MKYDHEISRIINIKMCNLKLTNTGKTFFPLFYFVELNKVHEKSIVYLYKDIFEMNMMNDSVYCFHFFVKNLIELMIQS